MSRSYKLCPVSFFDESSFSVEAYGFHAQLALEGVPQSAQTTIRTLPSSIGVDDFRSYAIEHEREVQQRGRFNDQSFNRYIQTSEIAGFYSESRQLLILSGRKNDILDFCAKNRSSSAMTLTTVKVDLRGLLDELDQVRLAWFRHADDASIQASALMGQHIEKTPAFQDAQSGAEISTLSFFVSDPKGVQHCVLVTSDGAVVPQGNYLPSAEMELVVFVKESMLDKFTTALPFQMQRRRK